MKFRALVLVLGLTSSPAMADPLHLAQAFFGGTLPPREIVAIVRSRGLVPVTPPALAGSNYALRAMDRYGTPVRVLVDARFGDIVSVRRIALANPPRPPAPAPNPPPADLLGPVPSDVDSDDEPISPPNVIPAVPPRQPGDPSAAVSPPKPPVAKRKPSGETTAAKPDSADPASPPANASTEAKPDSAEAASPPRNSASAKAEPKVGAASGAFPPVTPLQ